MGIQVRLYGDYSADATTDGEEKTTVGLIEGERDGQDVGEVAEGLTRLKDDGNGVPSVARDENASRAERGDREADEESRRSATDHRRRRGPRLTSALKPPSAT